MNEHNQELKMLQAMEAYEVRLHLVSIDLALARQRFDEVASKMARARRDETWFITMAKKYLKYYNEDNLEEDWSKAQEYLELAKSTKEYQQWLRELLPVLTEEVREYKKQWSKVNKMAELQQTLMQRTQKN